MLISATGQSVRACLAEARRVAGVKLWGSREASRSGGEDGLYRVTLTDGTVVECSVVQNGKSEAMVVDAKFTETVPGVRASLAARGLLEDAHG